VPAANSFPVANAPRGGLSAHAGSSRAVARAARATDSAVDYESRSDPRTALEPLEPLKSILSVNHNEPAAVVLPTRAETLEQARQEAAEQEAVATKDKSEKAKKAKKKRKKKGLDDLKETLTLVGGVSVFVGVLALLAWRFPDFRYPLGGLLAVIGFILYLLGTSSLTRLVENEGFFKRMAFRFFPPYQLWFVLARWDEARDYFAFFVSGVIVMVIGGAVVTTSPTFRKAAANEREYRKAVREAVYGELELKRPQAAPPPAAKGAQERTE